MGIDRVNLTIDFLIVLIRKSMPGFEVIGAEEFNEVKDVFDKGGVLFRHGFDNLRNNCYKTKEFEKEFSKKIIRL